VLAGRGRQLGAVGSRAEEWHVQDAAEASVNVGLDRPPTRYAREIFGHFIEHFSTQVYGGLFDPSSELSDERGFRLDVVEAMRELRPPVVRWPGGCFVSSYHWLDGVGPQRRSHYDKAWRVTDPNTFGTAEFVAWCEAIGAAPYICTNAGTGTAEEMSDWLEYCNFSGGGRWAELRTEHGRAQPFGVPYWSIGNENYGSWEMGAKTPTEWASLVRESAKMMRRVDESAVLLTAARSDLEWTLPLLEAAGPYLDMVSIHGYWDVLNQVNEPSGYLAAVGRSLGPQEEIARTSAILTATGLAGQVGIAFDEWNLRGWHHPDGTSAEAIEARKKNDDNRTYTMADALFSASFLNACLRAADVVTMANIAPSVNTRGPLFVHRDGVVRRSTFHVLSMYANLLGSATLDVAASADPLAGTGVPILDVLATTDDAGSSLQLVLVNRDPIRRLRCEVSVQGRPLQGTLEATVLRGDDPDAYNDVDSPDRVRPEQRRLVLDQGGVELEPHSLTVCSVALPLPHGAGASTVTLREPRDWALTPAGWRRSPAG
jgi:alpha-N-arabinofuranosidase